MKTENEILRSRKSSSDCLFFRFVFFRQIDAIQRNVGILEKIVQTMTATTSRGGGGNNEETTLQYNAQVDVIAQLASRVEGQLATAKRAAGGAAKSAIIKLECDFHRVQERVAALQESVTKMRQQAAALQQQQEERAAAGNSEEAMGYEEFQRHMELQLQQDVSTVVDSHVLILTTVNDWRLTLFLCILLLLIMTIFP